MRKHKTRKFEVKTEWIELAFKSCCMPFPSGSKCTFASFITAFLSLILKLIKRKDANIDIVQKYTTPRRLKVKDYVAFFYSAVKNAVHELLRTNSFDVNARSQLKVVRSWLSSLCYRYFLAKNISCVWVKKLKPVKKAVKLVSNVRLDQKQLTGLEVYHLWASVLTVQVGVEEFDKKNFTRSFLKLCSRKYVRLCYIVHQVCRSELITFWRA